MDYLHSSLPSLVLRAGGAGMDAAVQFGRRLRTLREAKGVKQRILAEKAKMSPSYVSQLETGKAQPSFDAIVTFARILDVPMYSFFLFDRDMDDPRLLRKRIAAMVATSSPERLKQVHRLMMDILEPLK
jgi:transcriptional regulator with XRE-family HTH domain